MSGLDDAATLAYLLLAACWGGVLAYNAAGRLALTTDNRGMSTRLEGKQHTECGVSADRDAVDRGTEIS